MVQIVDGNKIAGEILKDLKNQLVKIKSAGLDPRLIVFLVGEDSASLTYTRMKKKRGEQIGLTVEIKHYSEGIKAQELKSEIAKTSQNKNTAGIIVQLPLPPSLPMQEILDMVPPAVDVDCLTTLSKQALISGEQEAFIPPTVAAVLKILEYHNINLTDKQLLIVGAGELVGKPLAALLSKRKVSFVQATSKTENFSQVVGRADIIITGAGKPGLIKGEMVKDGVVVVDAGTAGTDSGALAGDVDFASVSKKASLITPIPGGVGPLTVAMLLQNVVASARNLTEKIRNSRI